MSDLINLNAISYGASSEIRKLDKKFVGTEDYMGVAFFWSHEYKHTLRDVSITQRRTIHHKALKLGIDFTKVGVKQWELLSRVLKVPVESMINKKYYKALKENKVPKDYLKACEWMEEVFYK
ncbi:MAG: hypothetical protein HKN40_09030 [Winogradskyella sp.]|uniref:hypothetical protein n=1 Tax=Winogradskyella sp. TaxID=1883156 RepID=UPI00181979A6|nr:hypothetical protein [Winogradskyella sp.]